MTPEQLAAIRRCHNNYPPHVKLRRTWREGEALLAHIDAQAEQMQAATDLLERAWQNCEDTTLYVAIDNFLREAQP